MRRERIEILASTRVRIIDPAMASRTTFSLISLCARQQVRLVSRHLGFFFCRLAHGSDNRLMGEELLHRQRGGVGAHLNATAGYENVFTSQQQKHPNNESEK